MYVCVCTSGVVLVKMFCPWMMSVITRSFSCWYSAAVRWMDSSSDSQHPHRPLTHKWHVLKRKSCFCANINDANYFGVALVQLPIHVCPGRLKTENRKVTETNRSENVQVFFLRWSWWFRPQFPVSCTFQTTSWWCWRGCSWGRPGCPSCTAESAAACPGCPAEKLTT